MKCSIYLFIYFFVWKLAKLIFTVARLSVVLHCATHCVGNYLCRGRIVTPFCLHKRGEKWDWTLSTMFWILSEMSSLLSLLASSSFFFVATMTTKPSGSGNHLSASIKGASCATNVPSLPRCGNNNHNDTKKTPNTIIRGARRAISAMVLPAVHGKQHGRHSRATWCNCFSLGFTRN